MKQELKIFDEKITELLQKGLIDGVYPGAVLLVASHGQINIIKVVGNRSINPEVLPMKKDTIFDLASLTKPLATTLAIMRLVDEGRIGLDGSLSEIIRSHPLGDKKDLTIRSILCHCAGLKDWVPFYKDIINFKEELRKRALRERIIEEPLLSQQGRECLYSDLGFIILEWVVEETSGESLRDFTHGKFYRPLGLKRTFLFRGETPFDRKEFASTEDCPWRKRIIQGEVHDENAYAAGGYSGHAGLFGTAEEIFIIADMLKDHYLGQRSDYFSPDLVREFFRRQEIVKGCTWALGWDTPSTENSSAGRFISRNSVGHLGFSGTSLWLDLDKDLIAIFLSNRVHTSRDNVKIKSFRPPLHELIFGEPSFHAGS
jgi:CubicO group peptidase (beta-lactamase class C family)